jgi:transcriptional regulator GlxA family with amidase domain
MTRSVAILLFEEAEVLDFAGPFEVFFTASRIHRRLFPTTPPPFEVFTIAEQFGPVATRGRFTVHPHHSFSSHPPIDLLIVPGGVISPQVEDPTLRDWIIAVSRQAELVASVCTGSTLLAQAGLLRGRQATTHWEDAADLQRDFPDVRVVADARWVDEGSIVTAAGISAGLDMCLHLVARFEGAELAMLTARQMDYRWQRAASESSH